MHRGGHISLFLATVKQDIVNHCQSSRFCYFINAVKWVSFATCVTISKGQTHQRRTHTTLGGPAKASFNKVGLIITTLAHRQCMRVPAFPCQHSSLQSAGMSNAGAKETSYGCASAGADAVSRSRKNKEQGCTCSRRSFLKFHKVRAPAKQESTACTCTTKDTSGKDSKKSAGCCILVILEWLRLLNVHPSPLGLQTSR